LGTPPHQVRAHVVRLGRRRVVGVAADVRNALDFHIAFYLGELLTKDPTAVFHVIAVDGGYDPLLRHLQDRKAHARKYKSIAEIPHVRAANSKTLSEKVAFVVESLADREGRPATVKTLSSTIECMFPNGLEEGVCGQVIQAMQSSGFITVNGTKVSYAANATEMAFAG